MEKRRRCSTAPRLRDSTVVRQTPDAWLNRTEHPEASEFLNRRGKAWRSRAASAVRRATCETENRGRKRHLTVASRKMGPRRPALRVAEPCRRAGWRAPQLERSRYLFECAHGPYHRRGAARQSDEWEVLRVGPLKN